MKVDYCNCCFLQAATKQNSDCVPLDRDNAFLFWLNLKRYPSFGK